MASSYIPAKDPLANFTSEELNKLLFYSEGKLYRKDKNGKTDFSRVAGGKIGGGYILVSIRNKQYLAHRVIWKMFYDELPETIDHVNGDRADNRLENLRAATKAENLRNAFLRKNNTSGVKGVSWRKDANKWRGYVSLNGKQHLAGLFTDKNECIEAVKILRIQLHEEFAKHAEAVV